MQTKTSIWLIATGFVLTFGCAAALSLYVYGPCIEPYVAGYVVEIPKPDQIWRGYITKRQTGREVEVACLRLPGLRKLAPAIKPKYAFSVETKLSDPINVSAYVADVDHQDSGDLVVHDVGAVWDRTYCFEMPGTIGDDQSIRVAGHSEHVRLVLGQPWPFWKSITPVPEVTVQAVRCYAPGVPSNQEGCR